MDMGSVLVEGNVFNIEHKELTKRKAWVVCFDITDNTASDSEAATAAPAAPSVTFTGYTEVPAVPDYAVYTGAAAYSLGKTGSSVLEGVYKFDITQYLSYIQLMTDLGYTKTVSGKTITFAGSQATVKVTEGTDTVTVKVLY